ncbi:unnamed protein product [Brassica napus]|uniref:(rape) hypothetical protein n=1 Tax=Brassica napus TaxID=3708 RepID=A0A816P3J2_BRANA|nr:unnamed protein product [Brassica napus]
MRYLDARSILTCGGEFNSRHIVRCSVQKALDDPKSSTRPQPQSGGKFGPRLNMGERPIANKVKEWLKLSGGKRMEAGDSSVGCGTEQRSADRFGAHAPHGVPRHLCAQGIGLWAPIRPALKHGPSNLTCKVVNG